jgi:hypothetical protein
MYFFMENLQRRIDKKGPHRPAYPPNYAFPMGSGGKRRGFYSAFVEISGHGKRQGKADRIKASFRPARNPRKISRRFPGTVSSQTADAPFPSKRSMRSTRCFKAASPGGRRANPLEPDGSSLVFVIPSMRYPPLRHSADSKLENMESTSTKPIFRKLDLEYFIIIRLLRLIFRLFHRALHLSILPIFLRRRFSVFLHRIFIYLYAGILIS